MSAAVCRAWLLPIAPPVHVAVGVGEIAHILAGRQGLHPVPRSPRWCHDVFLWQGQVVPLFDLGLLVRRETATGPTSGTIIMIVAYASRGGDIRFGGLRARGLPFSREVSDGQMCDYPVDCPAWERVAASCFADPVHGPVPILDLPRLFDSPIDNAWGRDA